MSASPVFVLLLQRADNVQHADRAWGRMASWEPGRRPSQLDDQINHALRLTRVGADPVELCDYDAIHVKRMTQERAEAEDLEAFKQRYRLR